MTSRSPVSELEFAVGVEAFGTLTPALTVELLDPELNSLGVTPVDTSRQALLSEELLSYSGVPVQRAVLDFDETKLGLWRYRCFEELLYILDTFRNKQFAPR